MATVTSHLGSSLIPSDREAWRKPPTRAKLRPRIALSEAIGGILWGRNIYIGLIFS